MRQFSIAHLAALATLVLGVSVAVIAPRRHPGRSVKWASWALAAAIFAGWAGEYAAESVLGTWTLRYSLPLQLTDAADMVMVVVGDENIRQRPALLLQCPDDGSCLRRVD